MPRATAVSRKEQWSDWSSGRHLLARVRQNGCWSDGLPLGRGHGQPYLQPAYAHALDLRKSVEGRPLEGWVVHVAAGDWITFKISSSGGQQLVCRVGDCLPDCPSIEAAVAVYHSLCNRKGISYAELAKTAGVAGIQIQPIHVSLRRTCWRCRALRASAPLLRLLPLPPKHGRRRRLGPGDAGVPRPLACDGQRRPRRCDGLAAGLGETPRLRYVLSLLQGRKDPHPVLSLAL